MATSRPETKQSVVPHAVGHQLLQRLRMPASPETRLTNNDDLDVNIGRVRVACVSRDPLTLSVNKKRAHSHIIHFVWRHPWKRSGREVSTARCYALCASPYFSDAVYRRRSYRPSNRPRAAERLRVNPGSGR
jgi:hypothetical protein